MDNTLYLAFMGGLAGMLGWGFADFFAKKTIDQIGDIPSLVWAHLFGTLGFLLVAIYSYFKYGQYIHIPHDPQTLGLLAFFGALQAAVYLLVYRAFEKGQVAVINPIFASYSGVVALISILFLGEIVSGNAILSVLVIFLGVILLSLDIPGLKSKKLNLHAGVKEVVIASILAAGWTLGWNKFVSGQDFIAYALFMYAFMTIAAFLYAKAKKIKLNVIKGSNIITPVVMIGLCEMVAYLGISLGFSQTSHTSIVAVLSGAFSLPTILLARAFLKEHITKIQTLGASFVILGAVLLAIF
jgi:drug/metabolite transporter (DMT)-like permease